ncbi:hypothetical protein ABT147_42295 [Streptomyces sp. NPDC001868]|uniref:hypothetical protein n=1 Tax=Streptomyces sp. NPDC001868 TaxID=3154401 RepID=UPI00332828BD
MAFKAMRDTKAGENVNEARFEQAGLDDDEFDEGYEEAFGEEGKPFGLPWWEPSETGQRSAVGVTSRASVHSRMAGGTGVHRVVLRPETRCLPAGRRRRGSHSLLDPDGRCL